MSVGARGPRFAAVTNSLVALASAGLCLKFASQYLPEQQPNRLIHEYGSYVRAASRHRVDWYPFSAEPFAKAAESSKLILLEVGTLLSRSSRSLTDIQFEDAEFARLLNDFYICIRADANELPGLVDTIALNTQVFGSAEGSVLLILDPSGRQILMSPTQPLIEGGRSPTLYERFADLAKQWAQRKDDLTNAVTEAAVLRARAAKAVQRRGSVDTGEFVSAFRAAINPASGALVRTVSPVAAPPPMLLISAGQTSAASDWLQRLRESACYDHVAGGFFTVSRGPGWRGPGCGKAAGTSAQLAAVYAQATRFESPSLFRVTAKQTAEWILTELREETTGLFMAGMGTDETTSGGSRYYHWSADELPEEVRAVMEVEPGRGATGPLRLKRSSRLREPSAQLRTEAVLRAAEVMSRLRSARKKPPMDRGLYADTNGKVISALFIIARKFNDRAMIRQASAAYRRAVELFVQSLGDVLHAPSGAGRSTGYAGDYVWMARAAIEDYLATADERALQDARRIMGRFIELFEAPGGGFYSFLGSQVEFAAFALPVFQVADRPDESINALAIRNLTDLSNIKRDSSYIETARRAAARFGGAPQALGVAACGYVNSIYALNRSKR